MKKTVITLCGELGAGKSTTTKLLQEKLGYERIYTGGLYRAHAEELGMTFDEYHKLAETDPKYDEHIDNQLKEFLNKGENIICDSYMASWFAPDAFKVFLDIDPRVAAERMFEDRKVNPDRVTEDYGSVEGQLEKNKERRASNVKRYREYYGVENYLDKNHYDIIVDTTSTPPEEVVQEILDAYQAWLNE
jgi:predicted cytidylate kinase